MSVGFNDLQTELEALVPEHNGVPTGAQYTQAIKSAVRDFSERAGRLQRVTITIVSGTADYTLPDNFLKVVRFEMPAIDDVAISSNGGIVPLSTAAQEEQYTITGRTLTLYPTPTYNMDRVLWYRARHALDDNENYPDMTDEERDLVLIKARANCYRFIRQSAAPGAFSYAIGDVRVDKSKAASSLKETAAELDNEYEERIEKYIGAVGVPADFSKAEEAAFLDY